MVVLLPVYVVQNDLQMLSIGMENLVIRARATVSNLIFGTTPSKTLSTDYNKPVFVPCAADSLEV